MSATKSKRKKIIKGAGTTAFVFLEAVVSAADACPPLKSAANGALHIAKLVKNFNSNSKDWDAFGRYVQDHIVNLFRSLPDISIVREDIRKRIENLAKVLEGIGEDIRDLQSQPRHKRILTYLKDPDRINEMKQRLEDSINIFMVSQQLTTGLDVATVIDAVKEDRINQIMCTRNREVVHKINHIEKFIHATRQEIEIAINISALPYAKDSGWDSAQTCLVNTRTSLIENIIAWVRATDISGSQAIYLVADVAGSGKSALAHTVAERCSDDRVLVSSFFYDRQAGRTRPHDFLYTLARDLCSRSDGIKELVSAALREEPSLVRSQSVLRIFKKLIMGPVTRCPVGGPAVIVVDALDECDSGEFLTILHTEFPKLPRNFRIFLTTRPERHIMSKLTPDIHPRELGIHETDNLSDIALYIENRLTGIASDHELTNWPSQCLLKSFLEKAEGLFIWAATICEYLEQVIYPDQMLEKLLEDMRESLLPPEKKMDKLYSMILEKCNWDDVHFVDGYQQVMGTIIAAKEPMTVVALQAIHGPTSHIRAQEILKPIASVVTGVARANPIRILHVSFQEFITLRAQRPQHIRAKEHSARLAVLCLQSLCSVFATSIAGTGYLSKDTDKGAVGGVPDVEMEHLHEESWYAIRFWPAHIVKVAKPDNETIKLLHQFFSHHLIAWVEVMASKDTYKPLTSVRRWLNTTLPHNDTLSQSLTNKELAQCLCRLPILLKREGRQQEALDTLEELTDISQRLRRSSGWDSDDSMVDLQSVSDSSDYEDSESDDDEQ